MTRFYVTMLWDDQPEGGSYGDIIEAESGDDAEALCRRAMAESRADERGPKDGATREDQIVEILAEYGDEWAVIDCFDLDEFIERVARKATSLSPIQFPEPTDYETLGRNGYSAAHGVDLSAGSNCVMLEPVNYRGDTTRARVCLHKQAIPEIIAQLRTFV